MENTLLTVSVNEMIGTSKKDLRLMLAEDAEITRLQRFAKQFGVKVEPGDIEGSCIIDDVHMIRATPEKINIYCGKENSETPNPEPMIILKWTK